MARTFGPPSASNTRHDEHARDAPMEYGFLKGLHDRLDIVFVLEPSVQRIVGGDHERHRA